MSCGDWRYFRKLTYTGPGACQLGCSPPGFRQPTSIPGSYYCVYCDGCAGACSALGGTPLNKKSTCLGSCAPGYKKVVNGCYKT